jgi:hypothetical protein
MTTRSRRSAPVACSAFAGLRFPPDVIVLAVRWYLRFDLILPRRRRATRRPQHRGRPRHDPPLGAAVHAAAGRGCPVLSARRRPALVRGRDLCEGGWPLALRIPGDRSVRPGHRCIRLHSARFHGRPPVLRTGHRHDQDAAGGGRDRPSADVPAGGRGVGAGGLASHRSVCQQPYRGRPRPPEGAAATDAGLEAGRQRQRHHHGPRVRAERSPWLLRRGYYELAVEEPAGRRLAVAFDGLAMAI